MVTYFALIWWILSLCHVKKCTALDQSNHTNAFHRLSKHLMKDYEPLVPSHSPMSVTIAFFLHSIVEVQGHTGEFKVFGYMSHAWEDKRLAWDPTDYDNISLLALPAKVRSINTGVKYLVSPEILLEGPDVISRGPGGSACPHVRFCLMNIHIPLYGA